MSCPNCIPARAEAQSQAARADREQARAERFESLLTNARDELRSATSRTAGLHAALFQAEEELKRCRDALSRTCLRRDGNGKPCWCAIVGFVEGVEAIPHGTLCLLARQALRVTP